MSIGKLLEQSLQDSNVKYDGADYIVTVSMKEGQGQVS
jgi:hypothetical protein